MLIICAEQQVTSCRYLGLIYLLSVNVQTHDSSLRPSVQQVFIPDPGGGGVIQDGHMSTRVRAPDTCLWDGGTQTWRKSCSFTDAENIPETQLPFGLPAVPGKCSLSNPVQAISRC